MGESITGRPVEAERPAARESERYDASALARRRVDCQIRSPATRSGRMAPPND